MDVIKYQFEVKKGMCRIIDQCDAKMEWAREKIYHSCFHILKKVSFVT